MGAGETEGDEGAGGETAEEQDGEDDEPRSDGEGDDGSNGSREQVEGEEGTDEGFATIEGHREEEVEHGSEAPEQNNDQNCLQPCL